MTLKTPWRDGTTHLCFEPVTLLERLAALTPRPRINVVLYHGVLAPRAKWRASAVTYGRADAAATQDDAASMAGPVAEVVATTSEATPGPAATPCSAPPGMAADVPTAADAGSGAVSAQPAGPPASGAPPPRWRWADLLQRVFAVDVLACPNCGGRMRLIATIEDPRVVRRILTHLGLGGDEDRPADLADP